MHIYDAEDILSLKESTFIEFKLSAGKDGNGTLPKSFWETYAAFANTNGGVCILGVKEKEEGDNDIIGVKNPQRIKKELFDNVHNLQKISVNLLQDEDVQEISIGDKTVLLINIAKASRKQKPVYVGQNPMTGTYVRRHDGDYRLPSNDVKRMLAEQTHDSFDTRILKGFSIEDLDADSVKAYRNTFAAHNPDHPALTESVPDFLRFIGAFKKNRELGTLELTAGGLLMFGTLQSIREEFPHYFPDYQEQNDETNRWTDRVTLDGTWSGNLYDFYRRVYPKITADIKVPFMLDGATRIDQTPVHEALREAFVNSIIHADYAYGRLSILAIKKPGMFIFRNPGKMRIPIERALEGGESDCRNTTLEQMFRHVKLVERSGSGIPKIYRNWTEQHWKAPKIIEKDAPDVTVIEMATVNLLPDEVWSELETVFGERIGKVSELERNILLTVALEKAVKHGRFSEMISCHPADISKALGHLCKQGFLTNFGKGRATHYMLAGTEIDKNESKLYGLFGHSLFLENKLNKLTNERSRLTESNSEGLATNSEGLAANSEGLATNSEGLATNSEGLEISEIERNIAENVFLSKKSDRRTVENTIIQLCAFQPQTLSKLEKILDLSPVYLRSNYLKSLVQKNRIKLKYPNTPNHPKQAYVTVIEEESE